MKSKALYDLRSKLLDIGDFIDVVKEAQPHMTQEQMELLRASVHDAIMIIVNENKANPSDAAERQPGLCDQPSQ